MREVCAGLCTLAVLVLVGCAATDFVRPPDSALVLGQTTYQDVLDRVGKPIQSGSVTRNGHEIETLGYAFAGETGSGVRPGITPSRAESFYFLKKRLVGYAYTSSFAVDHTDYYEAKRSRIEKGVATLTDVVGLLGTPSGRFSFPLVPNRGELGLVYLYSHISDSGGSSGVYHKQLLVTLDGRGVVTDVEFKEKGRK